MSIIETVTFVGLVVVAFVAIIFVGWRWQRRKNPERFAESFKTTPPPGSPNHWNRPRS